MTPQGELFQCLSESFPSFLTISRPQPCCTWWLGCSAISVRRTSDAQSRVQSDAWWSRRVRSRSTQLWRWLEPRSTSDPWLWWRRRRLLWLPGLDTGPGFENMGFVGFGALPSNNTTRPQVWIVSGLCLTCREVELSMKMQAVLDRPQSQSLCSEVGLDRPVHLFFVLGISMAYFSMLNGLPGLLSFSRYAQLLFMLFDRGDYPSSTFLFWF